MKFWADYGAYLPVRRIYAMLFDKVMAHNFELVAIQATLKNGLERIHKDRIETTGRGHRF